MEKTIDGQRIGQATRLDSIRLVRMVNQIDGQRDRQPERFTLNYFA
jgi:hypothetical protein